MMTDQEAHEYYYRIVNRRAPEPTQKDEQQLFADGIYNIQAIGDTYAHVAVIQAKAWYEKHKASSLTLGQCIETANVGLMHAAAIFYEKNHAGTIPFKDYAHYYIEEKLTDITDRTDTTA
jgi:hypothetical protein